MTLTVSADQSALKTKVGNFVTAYNTLYASFSKLRAYDPATQSAGPCSAMRCCAGSKAEIGLDLSNPVAGATGDYKTLASLGITRQTDGTLKVDGVKLDKALTADLNSVAKVFGGDTGVAGKACRPISTRCSRMVSGIDVRSDQLNATLKSVQDDKDQLDARMQVIQDRYTKQFTALDTLLHAAAEHVELPVEPARVAAEITANSLASTGLSNKIGSTPVDAANQRLGSHSRRRIRLIRTSMLCPY